MKNIKIILGTIFIAACIMSCDFSLEKTLELPELNFEEQIVIQSNLVSGSDSVVVMVARSESVVDQSSFEPDFFSGAIINLLFEGRNYGEFVQNNIGLYVAKGMNLEKGDYSLDVQIPLSDILVNGLTEIPQNIELYEVEYREDAGVHINFEERGDLVRIKFNDPPEKNYYGINLFYENERLDTIIEGIDTFYVSLPDFIDLETNEPGVIFYRGILLFDDSAFNGTNKSFEVVFRTYGSSFGEYGEYVEDKDLPRLEWLVYSEDQFKYLRSISISNDFGDGPFTDPITIHSNIENGLGIFGGQLRSFYDLE